MTSHGGTREVIGRLTKAQRRTLERLAQVSRGKVLYAQSIALRSNCMRCVTKGWAEHLGNDNWVGGFFRITAAGRAALARAGTGGRDG